ncbi:hypothetical protein SAMN05421788_108237 [Filimonas lacunae]|uniref:Uncharacterized protein n=1 Tax=Filimonas lacunae TaxID=477680 RepID=A0A1N7R205_9BACT|nr:hypothetical protein [Filimonas lacunae]SIT29178.1 hypothetical protein SAMN05421788_108237 [Filimonas lacunae]
MPAKLFFIVASLNKAVAKSFATIEGIALAVANFFATTIERFLAAAISIFSAVGENATVVGFVAIVIKTELSSGNFSLICAKKGTAYSGIHICIHSGNNVDGKISILYVLYLKYYTPSE